MGSKKILENFLIKEPHLLIDPKLASIIGLNGAIILQQIHECLNKSKHINNGYKWICNSYKDWKSNLSFWSIDTIKRTIRNLEKKKIIISGNYNRKKMDNTKWYRIDYDYLDKITGGKSMLYNTKSDFEDLPIK